MGFLNNMFSSSDENNDKSKKGGPAVNWINLEDLGQLENVISDSQEKVTVIFKHSTRCSISRMALKQFENEYNLGDKAVLYFLDLIAHRDVSNDIAARFGVVHQSPQIIVFKGGNPVFNTSHSDIDATKLEAFV